MHQACRHTYYHASRVERTIATGTRKGRQTEAKGSRKTEKGGREADEKLTKRSKEKSSHIVVVVVIRQKEKVKPDGQLRFNQHKRQDMPL